MVRFYYDVVLVTMCLCFTAVKTIDPTEKFQVCKRDNPDLNDCLQESIQAALPSLANGYPEVGLGPLDPYYEKELVIEYKRNQISGKASLKNIRVFGFSKAKIHDVRANVLEEGFDIEVDLSLKEMFVEGDFKAEGRLNALVFKTKGYFNNTMSDLTWTWKISGVPEVKKDGKTYVKINKFFMRPEVGNMKVYLPAVFQDNQDLSKIALDFANDNWRLIYRELLPVIELTWFKVGKKEINKIFFKIPYDELFPSS